MTLLQRANRTGLVLIGQHLADMRDGHDAR